MADLKYRGVLLKLSGDALRGTEEGASLDFKSFLPVAEAIEECLELGVRVGVVVGGGNFFRGRQMTGDAISATTADQVGMLATVMNALALEDFFNRRGTRAKAFSSVGVSCWMDPYEPSLARRTLESGTLVICAGGTGNTHFTTDTAAVLRAVELGVDVLLKGTRVDGVYSEDPEKNPEAKHYESLTFQEALEKQLEVMDQTAFALCRVHDLPIVVFSIRQPEKLVKAVKGEPVGTKVEKGD